MLLLYGSVPSKAEGCLGDPWERAIIYPDGIHNKHGLKPLGLEFNFLILRLGSVGTSCQFPAFTVEACCEDQNGGGGIPEIPDACVLVLPYGLTVQRAPPTPFQSHPLGSTEYRTWEKGQCDFTKSVLS